MVIGFWKKSWQTDRHISYKSSLSISKTEILMDRAPKTFLYYLQQHSIFHFFTLTLTRLTVTTIEYNKTRKTFPTRIYSKCYYVTSTHFRRMRFGDTLLSHALLMSHWTFQLISVFVMTSLHAAFEFYTFGFRVLYLKRIIKGYRSGT